MSIVGGAGEKNNNTKVATPKPKQPLGAPQLQIHALNSGWLTKRGSNRKNWKQRWFILSSKTPTIYYFKTQKSKTPQGQITLTPTTQVKIMEDSTKAEVKVPKSGLGTTIEIICPDRTWFLFAPSSGIQQSWLNSLTTKIKDVAAGAGGTNNGGASSPRSNPSSGDTRPNNADFENSDDEDTKSPSGGSTNSSAPNTPNLSTDPANPNLLIKDLSALRKILWETRKLVINPTTPPLDQTSALSLWIDSFPSLIELRTSKSSLEFEISLSITSGPKITPSASSSNTSPRNNNNSGANSSVLRRCRWRMRGVQTEVVQGMVDFFSELIQTNEDRLDKEVYILNKCGCGLNPLRIGSWISFYESCIETGWYFSVDVSTKTVITVLSKEANAVNSKGLGIAENELFMKWVNKWNVHRCLGVLREVGVGDQPSISYRRNGLVLALPLSQESNSSEPGESSSGNSGNSISDAFEMLLGLTKDDYKEYEPIISIIHKEITKTNDPMLKFDASRKPGPGNNSNASNALNNSTNNGTNTPGVNSSRVMMAVEFGEGGHVEQCGIVVNVKPSEDVLKVLCSRDENKGGEGLVEGMRDMMKEGGQGFGSSSPVAWELLGIKDREGKVSFQVILKYFVGEEK